MSNLPRTTAELEKWRQVIDAVQDHPLSQMKVINTQVLEQLLNVLEHMNQQLSSLSKLDEILLLLKDSKKQLEKKGVKSEALDKAIEQIELLSLKDKEAFDVLKKKGPLTAEQLAKELGISRSTASSRLNRLYSFGRVDKHIMKDSKKVLFEVKE